MWHGRDSSPKPACAEHTAEDRRPKLHGSIHGLRGGLLLFLFRALLGLADLFLQRGQPGSVLDPQFLHLHVTLLFHKERDPHAEVARAFSCLRAFLQRLAFVKCQPLRAIQMIFERCVQLAVRLRLRQRRRQGSETGRIIGL